MVTGRAMIIAIAAKWDHGVLSEYCPTMLYSAIISVKSLGCVRNSQEVGNSVQVLMKPRKNVTARTGVESGKVTRKKAVLGVQPSISAASSNSFGMVSR